MDYRDRLSDFLDIAKQKEGLSKYRLAKELNMSEATLSNVLAKRRHFSMERLDLVLARLGLEVTFQKRTEEVG